MSTPGTPQRNSAEAMMRSALLGLSTRIAEAQTEDGVCQAVVDGLSQDVFAFEGVGLYLVGASTFAPSLRASAGAFGSLGAGVAELRVPLRVDQVPIGDIVVQRARAGAYERADMELVTAAANQAGMAIGRARLSVAEHSRLSEQRALLDTLTDLSGELELDRLLESVLRRAIQLLNVTGGELAIYEETTRELVIASSYNMEVNAVGTRMRLGEGAMGHVGETHEPLIIPRYQEWSGRSGNYTQSSVQAVMAAPLLIGDRLVGAIASVHEDPERTFGEDDLRLLNLFAVQAAIAVENARLFTAERERASEQKALLETLADLSGELQLDRLLRAVLERAVSLLGVTGGELAIYDETKHALVISASYNMEVDAVGTEMALGEGAMGYVAQSLQPLIIPRYQEWAQRSESYQQSSVQAVMAAPLVIGTRLVGAIASVHADPSRQFGDSDLRRLMMFAPQAAIAIENARLYSVGQRYFEDLVLNNPIAIVNLDLDYDITSCNPAFERLFGYTEQEVIGQNLDRLVTNEGTFAEARALTESSAAGAAHSAMGRRRRKDGTMVEVEISAIPVMVGDRPVGMMALYHDVSELLNTRRAAEEANAAKSQFLAAMSHELRTPLNAILGYSELLQEDAADAGQERFIPDLAKIHSAGTHLLTLINDVLDLSKIEAGKMELAYETFDVRDLVQSVATTVQPLIAKHHNTLSVQIAGDIGEMYADATRVRQILLNFLSNSSKFTERGVITLSAMRAAGEILFSVRDTGIGMTEEQVGRLFQEFSQAEATTAAKYGGTGLGLAISKRFCEMMGGSVAVASTPGTGTTFTVHLPLNTADVAASAAVGPVATGLPTVLVIDDDPAARDLIRKMLAKEQVRVVSAATGEEGLAVARAERPAVIALDVVLPGMDGWAVLSALKNDPTLSEIPVVMTTMLDDRNLGLALGASEYLTKPIDRKRLTAVLARHLPPEAGTVLIVEDDDATRAVARRVIQNAGWRFQEAENGRVALARVEEALPSLILLDLMMPEMDGFTFLESLRARDAWRGIPVAVITAKELTADDHRRLNGGVQQIVRKGAGNGDFLTEVRALVKAGAR